MSDFIFIKLPHRKNLIGFDLKTIYRSGDMKVCAVYHQNGDRLMRHQLEPDFYKENPEIEQELVTLITDDINADIKRSFMIEWENLSIIQHDRILLQQQKIQDLEEKVKTLSYFLGKSY